MSSDNHCSGSVTGQPSQPDNQPSFAESEQANEAQVESTKFEQSVDTYLRSVRRKVTRRQEKEKKRHLKKLADRERLREALEALRNEYM